ncbi:MAG: hypothetical protein Q8P36_00010 [bacterium]|nr:hypothetical protein [bacterium]
MPSRNLQRLIARHIFTTEDWVSLLEERRAMIKPYLDRFTLEKLGDIKCLRNGGFSSHPLKDDSPSVSYFTATKEHFSLETQATWGGDMHVLGYDQTTQMPQQSKWGLSRSGLWLLAIVSYYEERTPRYYERARQVHISSVDLPDLLLRSKRRPQDIWEELADRVRTWLYHNESIYRSLKELDRTFQEDNSLYRALQIGETA